ncbi:hypothetical protein D9756_010526 [Leucocoprinus leucothites]|uniref:Uncharacterized protein n=1 Tax=Leucocoprinus leucothites TaxID=201217 RepID=A0A8H5FTN7_9AGAR|nr:hypothetical protein D9756_010526 [Leucoagaricus leucothites]
MCITMDFIVSIQTRVTTNTILHPCPGSLSTLQWLDSSSLLPDVDSIGLSDTWSSLSSSSFDHSYAPVDENNYLTWSYDVSDVNPSLYAPSTLPSHPASPSMSILSASTEDSTLSPPPSLAEFGNVFDFAFNASLPNEMQASASSQHWLQAPAQHSHIPSQHTFSKPSCPSPAQSSAVNAPNPRSVGALSLVMSTPSVFKSGGSISKTRSLFWK